MQYTFPAIIKTCIPLMCLILSGCDGQTPDQARGSKSSSIDGEFTVRISNGTGFSHASDRARIEIAKDNMIGLKASGWHLRLNPRGMPDTGAAETTEFGRNNTTISLYVEIGGERKRVGCDPADPEQGWFKRTGLADGTISGEFSITFVTCDDYFSAAPVVFPDLPLTVEGRFTNLALTTQ